MQVFHSIADFRPWRVSQGLSPLGFVPSMGSLHRGHMSLLKKSVAENPVSVVSIFVNPLQFGPKEDFSRYPRSLEADIELCNTQGASAVFAPDEDFYNKNHSSYCNVEGLDSHLCGASRPGHFRGVCTVVMKLFQIVQPSNAYFGQKDLQQALILKRMVSDLNVPLSLKIVETLREKTGLALSSRNQYLSDDEKKRAVALYQSLQLAKSLFQAGERECSVIMSKVREVIQASQATAIDYVEVVDTENLQPIEVIESDTRTALALAVYYGKTRLIDNIFMN